MERPSAGRSTRATIKGWAIGRVGLLLEALHDSDVAINAGGDVLVRCADTVEWTESLHGTSGILVLADGDRAPVGAPRLIWTAARVLRGADRPFPRATDQRTGTRATRSGDGRT